MGDGIFDHYVMREVGYSIAPVNADQLAKESANHITKCSEVTEFGSRSLSTHIIYFFCPYDPGVLPDAQIKLSGEWSE